MVHQRQRASTQAEADRLQLRDRAESASAAFPPMLVAAQRIANSVIQGMHGRRRAGPGEDFWQYRQYSPGDAAQRIDWRKSARSGRVLIRENEWAATNTLWLWASTAPGMTFRSRLASESKRDRSVLLAIACGMLAVKAGERVAAIGAPFPPGHTSRSLGRIAGWYTGSEPGDDQELPAAIALPRHSTCLLIGDFLSPLEQMADCFGTLAGNGVAGHVVQVLDPAEETLPYDGRTEFLEFGGARKLIVGKAQTLRQDYVDLLQRHRSGLRDLARRLGWSFAVHHTDQSPQTMLMTLYGLISASATRHSMAHAG